MRVTDVLRGSDLFEQLSTDELQQLAQQLQERQVRRGDVLCNQGDPANAMFIIVDGCLQLTSLRPDGRLRMIRQLSAGDSFGEIALFSGDRHSATATAMSDGRVAELCKDAFEGLVATRPGIMRTVLAAVSRRAARAHRLITPDPGRDVSAVANSRVYAVFSPRGGSGKTTLAINLAMRLLKTLPGRVALVDLDLVFDDAALLLNVDQPVSLAGIPDADVPRLDARMLGQYVVEHASGLRVVVGAARPEDGERVGEAHVRNTLAAMRRRFTVTVVDCGSAITKPGLAALESADRLIVVCTPELTTLRDVRDFQRSFGRSLQVARNRSVYVLNHPIPTARLSRSRFEGALEHSIAVEVPYAGGNLVHAEPRSAYMKAMDRLLSELDVPEVEHDAPRAAPADAAVAAAPAGQRLLQMLNRRMLVRHGG